MSHLCTASANVVGGRDGHAETGDGLPGLIRSIPRALGGPDRPQTTHPERLFVVGHAARIGGADRETAEALVAAARQISPYSKAMRGNIAVTPRVVD